MIIRDYFTKIKVNNVSQHMSEMLMFAGCNIVCVSQLRSRLLWQPNGAWQLVPTVPVPW